MISLLVLHKEQHIANYNPQLGSSADAHSPTGMVATRFTKNPAPEGGLEYLLPSVQQAYQAPYVPFVSHFYLGAYKPTYTVQFSIEHGLTLQVPDSYMSKAGL